MSFSLQYLKTLKVSHLAPARF